MARVKGVSYFSSPNAIFDLPVGPNEKLILFNLCRRAGPDGDSFPSIKRIAADCSLSESTVQRAVKRLRDAGYIEVASQETVTGATTANLYALQIQSHVQGGVTQTPGGVSHRHPHYIEGRPNKKETPSSPKGDADVPVSLRSCWGEWLEYRKERRLAPYKPSTVKRLLNWLQEQPDPAAVVDQSIRQGWQGLFELKAHPGGKMGPVPEEEDLPFDDLDALKAAARRWKEENGVADAA
jgi:hypothetical protein